MPAAVTGGGAAELMGYIEEAKGDSHLRRHVLEATGASPYRHRADARVDFGRRLGWYALARATCPALIVETGVDKGLGAVLLCSALLRNGSGRYLVTDIDPRAGWLLSGRYAEAGRVLYGDSIQSLERLDGSVDMFINDSDHSAGYEVREYRAVSPRLSERALVLADNTHGNDCLAEWAEATDRRFLFWREQPHRH